MFLRIINPYESYGLSYEFKKQKKLIWIVNPYESYESSIRMSHTDRQSVFNKRVNDILALSPVLLDVQQKC